MAVKFVTGSIKADSSLGPRQIRVIASDPTMDRAMDILEPSGCIVRGKSLPVILDHNASVKDLVGRVVPEITSTAVKGLVTFLPEGIDQEADKACAKAKAGFLTSLSVGFNPLEWTPIKGGGLRYTKWEWLELSLVVVGCNPSAEVIERAARVARVPAKEVQKRQRIARALKLAVPPTTKEEEEIMRRVRVARALKLAGECL